MDVSSHTLMLPAGPGIPEWIHLVPAGEFSGLDGKPYKLTDPAGVIAASMTAIKLPVDENHSTQRAPDVGAPSPARGWIVEMAARPDGIWGRVEWNESGTALMTDKSYKGISPVFQHKKDGTVVRILSAALTNNPNLPQLTALHTNNGNHMDKKAICAALGLAETVEDAALMTALQTQATALQTAQAEVTRLKAEVDTLSKTAVPVSKVTELETKLATMEAARKHEAAVTFVDNAIKAGKPIVAGREVYIAQHVANPAETEKMVNALPSLNAGGMGGRKKAMNDATDGDPDMAEMTAEDMAITRKMGNDPKKFAAFKKARAKTTEGSEA